MRSAFFMLLAANLAFMAWAGWIDRPAEARVVESATRLPRLWFAGEKPGDEGAGANQTNSGGRELNEPSNGRGDSSRATVTRGAATTGSTVSPGSASSNRLAPAQTQTLSGRLASAQDAAATSRLGSAQGSSSNSALNADGGATRAAGSNVGSAANSGQVATPAQLAAALRNAAPVNGQPLATAVRTAAAGNRCLTVGPFKDVSRSGRAISLLRARGFAPKQRTENGDSWAGYWVYVGGLKTEAEEADVLRKLEANGITDAHSMPDSGSGLQVSVGLFSDRGGADRRARSVQRLGLNADIMEKSQAGTLYWVDLNPEGSKQPVPTEGLLALEETGTRLEMKVCPRGA